MDYITTSDGRVGLLLSEYRGYKVEIIKPDAFGGGYAELTVNGQIIRYRSDEEAIRAEKEISEQLKKQK